MTMSELTQETGWQGLVGGVISGTILGAVYGYLVLSWSMFQSSAGGDLAIGIVGIIPGAIIGAIVGFAVGAIDGVFWGILARVIFSHFPNTQLRKQMVGIPCTILAILCCLICFKMIAPFLGSSYTFSVMGTSEIFIFMYTAVPALMSGLGAAYTSKTLLRWYELESQKDTTQNVTPN